MLQREEHQTETRENETWVETQETFTGHVLSAKEPHLKGTQAIQNMPSSQEVA